MVKVCIRWYSPRRSTLAQWARQPWYLCLKKDPTWSAILLPWPGLGAKVNFQWKISRSNRVRQKKDRVLEGHPVSIQHGCRSSLHWWRRCPPGQGSGVARWFQLAGVCFAGIPLLFWLFQFFCFTSRPQNVFRSIFQERQHVNICFLFDNGR